MKKIININFHSRVIPIEETAYEMLQQYIASLRIYFANEEGRDEIISDIENRFAELFSETLKKGAPCITDADVNAIIASMGRPEEFEGEEAESARAATGTGATAGGATGAAGTGGAGGQQQNWQYANEPRRLYRAENDKILGGVCAGLANYLKIDPAIVRIIFVLLCTGWGAGFLVYIVLWLILPTRALPAAVRKRLYRNPDDRVIGGVASGLAAYFHMEVWIPRLIFCLPLVLSIVSGIIGNVWFPWHHWGPAFFTGGFGGTLFVTYIVLWIVLPEATSASEKLEMRGEKVDLESIKNTIKSDLESFKGRATEMGAEMRERFQDMGSQMRQSAQSWGTEAGPTIRRTSNSFGHAIGVLFKAFFLFIAGIIAFALIMVLAGLAFRGSGVLHLKAFILEGFWQNFLAWSAFFLFLVIPIIALLTWLIRRISGTRSRSHYLGYTFATLWVIGLFATITLCGMVLNNFRSQQHVEQAVEVAQPAGGKLLVRTLQPINRYDDTDWWFDIDMGRDFPFYNLSEDSILLTTVRVRVLKSDDSAYHVNLVKISRGSSGASARELASNIRFRVDQQDSLLNLPQGFAIARGDKFRNQRVLVQIAVPVGKRIQIGSSVEDYKWFSINPGRRHIHWDDGDHDEDWSATWDDDISDANSYPWTANVEYRMTATGLVRTDKKGGSYDENKNYKSEDRSRKDKDDDDNDDDPGYKSSKPAPAPAKPDNGGYRYKGPGSHSADSPAVKKTAMRMKPETNLLNMLDKV
ncbi:MAG TPA: PspC domain-containing protein [Puia sp.]|nr:PspC domain-containing protein [Puia sp.]